MSTTRKIKADYLDGVRSELNYFQNSSANDKITLWNRFLDAAASRPTDGTGGSPSANVTWTRTTSDPIQGDGSFLYSKLNSANTQGEGVSYDFTIPNGQQGRVQRISFDYQVPTGTYNPGTSTTDSDLIIYMYRVTATGRLIEPSVFKLDGAVAGITYSVTSEFQTDIDAVAYRFIIYSATTSTSNFTVKFDNFYIGPSRNVIGSVITPFTAYTPTVAGLGTITDVKMFWRRVGDSLHVKGSFGTGTATGSQITISLPSGLSWDSTKIGTVEYYTVGTIARVAGTVNPNHPSASGGPFVLYPRAVLTSVAVARNTNAGQWSAAAGTDLFGNNEYATLEFFIPISGWSATATLGQDADTRDVLAVYQINGSNATASMTTGTTVIIDFNVKVKDTHGAVTTGAAWNFRCPIGGDYDVEAFSQLNNVTATTINQGTSLQVFKDGVLFATISSQRFHQTTAATTIVNTGGCTVTNCVAGTLLSVRTTQASGNTTAVSTGGSGTDNMVYIRRRPGPSQIAAAEVVKCRYGGSTSAVGTTPAVVIQPTKAYDSHNMYNTSTGIATIPITGTYRISATLNAGSAQSSSGTNRSWNAVIYRGTGGGALTGNSYIGSFQYQVASVTMAGLINGTTEIDCIAGDQIALYSERESQIGAFSLSGNVTLNWLSISKVG